MLNQGYSVLYVLLTVLILYLPKQLIYTTKLIIIIKVQYIVCKGIVTYHGHDKFRIGILRNRVLKCIKILSYQSVFHAISCILYLFTVKD